MSSRNLILTLAILFPEILFCQDYSDFMAPFGFHLPPLKSGQYLFAFTPHFSSLRSTSTLNALHTQSTAKANQKIEEPSGQSYLDLNAKAIYGLSDLTTLSIDMTFSPNQKMRDHSYSYDFSSTGYSHTINNKYTDTRDLLYADMILAVRPDPTYEVSLTMAYANMNTPYGMTGSDNLINGSSITRTDYYGDLSRNVKTFDISLSFVLKSR